MKHVGKLDIIGALLKGWFHGWAHVQAMTQDKAIPLFMDQSEASMLSRAKFLPVGPW